jgi:hypothetical protein
MSSLRLITEANPGRGRIAAPDALTTMVNVAARAGGCRPFPLHDRIL